MNIFKIKNNRWNKKVEALPGSAFRNRKTTTGFTLIELLVVISIIGLLSSIVLASLVTARNKAKASKITQDILQLRNAFELYKSTHGLYPGEEADGGTEYYSFDGGDNGLIDYLTASLVSEKFIPALPFSDMGDIASIHPVLNFAPVVYIAGNSFFLDETGAHNKCAGKNISNGYLFAFYSDKKLNLGNVSVYDLNGADNQNWILHPVYLVVEDNGSGYWYCISS